LVSKGDLEKEEQYVNYGGGIMVGRRKEYIGVARGNKII
jgi:hypothetical protein